MVRRRKREEVPQAAKNRKAAAPKNSQRRKGERIEAIAKVAESRERRTNKRIREPSAKITHAIMEFCNELGFNVNDTFSTWLQLSMCFEFELGVSQHIAEVAAWRDLKFCLDKRLLDQEMCS